VFDYISKHLEVRQKYCTTHRIFNSLLGVLKCGQTHAFVFDVLRVWYITCLIYYVFDVLRDRVKLEHLQSNTLLKHRGLWIMIWEQQQESWKNLPRKEMSQAQISDLCHVCFNRNWRPKGEVCSIMPCESLFAKRNYTERNLYLLVYVKFINEAAIDKHPKWSLKHLVWLQGEIIKLKTIHLEFVSLRYRRILNSKNRKDISASWREIEILPPKQMNANSTVCFGKIQGWDNIFLVLILYKYLF